jgi:hypothetical protein
MENSQTDLINMILVLSHLVVAIILIIVLKNTNPLLLALLLALMVAYICYQNRQIMPLYLLPAIGLLVYSLELLVSTKPNQPIYTTILGSIWRVPYWSILSYYIIILSQSLINNKKINECVIRIYS